MIDIYFSSLISRTSIKSLVCPTSPGLLVNQKDSTIYTDKVSVTIMNTAQRKLAQVERNWERILFLSVEENSHFFKEHCHMWFSLCPFIVKVLQQNSLKLQIHNFEFQKALKTKRLSCNTLSSKTDLT